MIGRKPKGGVMSLLLDPNKLVNYTHHQGTVENILGRILRDKMGCTDCHTFDRGNEWWWEGTFLCKMEDEPGIIIAIGAWLDRDIPTAKGASPKGEG